MGYRYFLLLRVGGVGGEKEASFFYRRRGQIRVRVGAWIFGSSTAMHSFCLRPLTPAVWLSFRDEVKAKLLQRENHIFCLVPLLSGFGHGNPFPVL